MKFGKIGVLLAAALLPVLSVAQLPNYGTPGAPRTQVQNQAQGQQQQQPAAGGVNAAGAAAQGGATPAEPFFSNAPQTIAPPQRGVIPQRPQQVDATSGEFTPTIPDAQVTESDLSEAPVFGRSLFQGRFATESFKGFNPDYLISVGDQIDVKLWGAVDAQLIVPVDAQGNIFLPRVGPIRAVNVRNGELNEVVKREVRRTYREEVGVYATLAAAVPVKVFVSGFVRRPGLYPGYASDSLLSFLDRAGGIDPLSGSYIDVRVLRGSEVVKQVDLYDFLVKGSLAQVQLRDGDSIFVGPIGSTAMVQGLVASPAQFEFRPGSTVAELLAMAGVNGRATNISITRSKGARREVIYVPVGDAALNGPVVTGDYIEVMADRLIGQIAISLEGEHEGAGQYILPYSATLADMLREVKYSPQSEKLGIQLYRKSVAARQKEVLDQMLEKLEQAVLSARSTTTEEAALRTQEAQLVLQFIERARKIRPKGQVVLPRDVDPSTIAMEDGDVVRIPRLSNLVQVHGEVFLPNAFVWRKGYYVSDYINQAGGLIQKSTGERVLLMRPSGEIASEEGSGFVMSERVEPGDEVLVLPGVDTKHFQFGKDVIQVIYQIAIAAGVLARL